MNRGNVLAGLFGAFFGLALLKFGNPPVMDSWVSAPKGGYELVLGTPWPISWAYWMLAGLIVGGAVAAKGTAPLRLGRDCRISGVLALAWLLWVFVSAFSSSDPGISWLVFRHFAAAVACFFLGLLVLPRAGSMRPFWVGILAGFALMLAAGWSQHFGGLEQTRRYFHLYLYPRMTDVSPEYLKKISSDRIFGTQFYPNTLAGALLLFTFPLLWLLRTLRRLFSPGARGLLAGLLAAGSAGCLIWSGSKGGWLLMLLLLAGLLVRSPLPRKARMAVLALCVIAGVAGFAWRYAAFFQRGATSVGARLGYWSAAARIACANPFDGAGPGTFGREYERIKPPGAESARLAHNDYLQQASDSGWPAALAYTGFVVFTLGAGWPRSRADFREADDAASGPGMRLAVALGLSGWALHSGIEFVLYIPALAWPAFALLGWLLAAQPPGPGSMPAPS